MGIIILEEDEDEDEFISEIRFIYLNRSFLDYDRYTAESNNISYSLDNELPQNYTVKHIQEAWGTPTMDMIIDIFQDNFFLGMDLLSLYQMYRNRGDCLRVNKNYAKYKVIEYLN